MSWVIKVNESLLHATNHGFVPKHSSGYLNSPEIHLSPILILEHAYLDILVYLFLGTSALQWKIGFKSHALYLSVMDLEDDRRTISSFGSADEFIGNRVHLEGANIGRVSMNLDELNSLKKEAISIWCRRVIIITILQLVAVIIEFISEYWYINALGVVLSAVGFYGAYQKASEAIFVVSWFSTTIFLIYDLSTKSYSFSMSLRTLY